MGEEDGNALLVSELVEGSTLASLAGEDVLSDREIGEIGADLCEALDHAHSRGVIHRDIKPQNVQVVDGQPRAKLMDFGIALITDAAGLTATGDVIGTLAYMSPEQAEGLEAGPEADVYSLALTLYECWSGENPHRRGNAVATVRSIGRRARSLHRLRPDLPRELDRGDRRLPRPAPRPPPDARGGGHRDRGLARPARRPSGRPDPPRRPASRGDRARRRGRRGPRARPWAGTPLESATPPQRRRLEPATKGTFRSPFSATLSQGSKASSRGCSRAPSAPRCSRSNWPANWPRKWTRTRPPRCSGSTSPTSTRSSSPSRTARSSKATSARSSRSSPATSSSTPAGAATTC